MKKVSIILSFFILISTFYFSNFADANEENHYYAKISNSATFLCSTPSENSALFEIPKSYFIEVNGSVDDYFKATYNQISGYVKKDKVCLMNGIPQTPFATATFKLFVPHNLYSAPNNNSTVLSAVNSSTTLNFYGTISGQQLNSSTNIWYYCSFQNADKTLYGYVFSGIADYLTQIPTNNEVFETINEDAMTNSTQTSEFSSLSTGTKIMLIVAISVPSAFILYFLVKPSRILNNKAGLKKKSKISRHGDYFEFDEKEL